MGATAWRRATAAPRAAPGTARDGVATEVGAAEAEIGTEVGAVRDGAVAAEVGAAPKETRHMPP